MNRRVFLSIVIVLAGGAMATGGRSAPNILFIAVDDLKDRLGCYGAEDVMTPHIDRLAERSVVFERAYVQYPVCNPSRCSFLTGLRPDETGVLGNNTPLRDVLPDVVTFPQLLRQNGYYAASFGKIFHLGGGRNEELRRKWLDVGYSWDEAHRFDATEAGGEIEGRNLTGGALSWCRWAMTAGTDDDQPDGQNASEAIRLMDKLDREKKPWLIGVGFHKPHDPFVAPKKYFDLYPPESIELYRDPEGMTPAPPLSVGFGGFGREFAKFTDKERREFQRAYYACVSYMDAQLGRLLDALDERDAWDNTLVFFLSDHGYHLGERNWWNKNTLFERSCRSPLMIAAPGARPGRAGGLVEFVDFYPTIADYCGVKPPAGLAGTSLRPLLEDPAGPGKKAVFTIVSRGGEGRGDAVRTDRWRYVEWSDGARELYDHENDPEETINLAADPERKGTVREHAALLRKQRAARRLPGAK